MSHITVPAEERDGRRILEILECSPAKGQIELLYTRRPNAYLSYKLESCDTSVFAVKEGERIIATAAEITRDVYIGGEEKKLCYVCGLKKDIYYDGVVNWGKLFIRNLVRDDIDCYFCSIIGDNISAQKLFEKKRKHTLNHYFLQNYTTYMLAPNFRFRVSDRGYTFSQAETGDEADLLEFLNREGRKKEFFPVIRSLNQFAHLDIRDFYILRDEQGIAAVGALWNQSAYRQYIVRKYRGLMKCARLFNPLLKLLGYIQLPKENAALDFPMLSFFISRDDGEEHSKVFLNSIAPVIRKKYGMVVIGASECSHMNGILRKLRSISFGSRIYTIDFILGGGKSLTVDKDKVWLECGLL